MVEFLVINLQQAELISINRSWTCMVLYGPMTPGSSQPLPLAWKKLGPQQSSHTLWELTTLIISSSHMTNRSRGVHWYFDYYSHTPLYGHPLNMDTSLERFSYDLDKKRANKTEIERFDWFIERIQTRVAFGGLFLKLHARELSRNQLILRFESSYYNTIQWRLANRTMLSPY